MNRSKDGALQELDKIRQEMLSVECDPSVSVVLTYDLLKEVLDIAWRHQFDDERGAFRQEIQQVIADAVERHYLRQEGK